MAEKDVRYYRRLPYGRVVDLREDSDGSTYFLASIKEIPSIRIHGPTREEALLKLDEIFDDMVECMLAENLPVPEPELWPAPYMQSSADPPPRRAQLVTVYRASKTKMISGLFITPHGDEIPAGKKLELPSSRTAGVS